MKKFIIGLLCGAALSMSTAAFAADAIQTILFPSKITFQINGNQTVLNTSDEIPVLNYKNQTYIPLRSFAEAMGASVDFVAGSDSTNHLNLITVSSKGYTLKQYDPTATLTPANAVCSPLSAGLRLPDEYRQNSDSLTIENTNNFVFYLMNRTSDNLIPDPATNIDLEVYTALGNTEDQLVYRYVLPPIPARIPSRSSYELTIPWSQIGLDGEKIAPGSYIVKLSTSGSIDYKVEGDNNAKSSPTHEDVRCGLNRYIVNYK